MLIAILRLPLTLRVSSSRALRKAQKRPLELSAFRADAATTGGLVRIVEEELTAIPQASRPSACALPPEFAEEHDDAGCDGHVE